VCRNRCRSPDDVEAQFRVELARPVVLERLEEDEVVHALCLLERELHDGAPKASAPKF